jgi:hypothetical protein
MMPYRQEAQPEDLRACVDCQHYTSQWSGACRATPNEPVRDHVSGLISHYLPHTPDGKPHLPTNIPFALCRNVNTDGRCPKWTEKERKKKRKWYLLWLR